MHKVQKYRCKYTYIYENNNNWRKMSQKLALFLIYLKNLF